MNYKILVINPGSTSTKLAVYENKEKLLQENISHDSAVLQQFDKLTDQIPMRMELIADFLDRNSLEAGDFDAIVGRGGLVKGLKTGGYLVDEKLERALQDERYTQAHASDLGGLLAKKLADKAGKPAYIYDAVTSAELPEVAKITGFKEHMRQSQCHVLNMRATAMKLADDLGKRYEDLDLIAVHLGGGISASVHQKGHIIDSIGDDDGPFSPERAGSVNGLGIVDLCYCDKYTKQEMYKKIRGKGGLYSHLGTSNCIEIEKMIEQGDEYAALVFKAQALQIAKCIGELSVVLKGKADGILLTGGVAYSKMLTDMIREYVSFIAPVYIYPGENEMEALAMGAYRILTGEEQVWEYAFPGNI